MLEASGTFLAALPDDAFRLAPEYMRRKDFEDFFRWYDLLDS